MRVHDVFKWLYLTMKAVSTDEKLLNCGLSYEESGLRAEGLEEISFDHRLSRRVRHRWDLPCKAEP